jgi:hypothetical protein
MVGDKTIMKPKKYTLEWWWEVHIFRFSEVKSIKLKLNKGRFFFFKQYLELTRT